MRSTSPRGCVRGFGGGFLLAASVYDLLVAHGLHTTVWPTVTVLLVGLAAVL
ncbi:hypothetical protein ACH4E5_04390 [Streptomyces afghaniensis]|uniref:hypothetical protein n=1 Tax=Streptomyces afghaniensis TaxID=66865 RepID=UPI0037A6F5D9